MVMTRSSGFGRRRLAKESSSNKGKIFDQEESAMDSIDVEPLRSAPPASLMPYGTSEDEVLTTNTPSLKENSPIKSQNVESRNLGDIPL